MTAPPFTLTGPPPTRVTGPPFSPTPFVLSPSSSPGSPFFVSPTSHQVPGYIQEVAPVLLQGGAGQHQHVLQGGGEGEDHIGLPVHDQQDGADPEPHVVAPALLDVPRRGA